MLKSLKSLFTKAKQPSIGNASEAEEKTNLELEADKDKALTGALATKIAYTGAFMILSGVALELYKDQSQFFKTHTLITLILRGIEYLLRDGGIALLSGGVIATILEVKNLIDFTTHIIIKALTSNSYLERMPVSKLKEIKESCSSYIYAGSGLRNEENLTQSLHYVESQVSELHLSSYYEEYKITIECEEKRYDEIEEFKTLSLPSTLTGEKITVKTQTTKYTLVNPQKKPTKEIIESIINLPKPDFVTDPTILNRFSSFSYRADNKKWETKEVTGRNETAAKIGVHGLYNACLKMTDKSGAPVSIDYNEKLEVAICEVRLIVSMDTMYVKKMPLASKRTSLKYFHKSPDVKLRAECFGFGSKQDFDNSVEIEYNDHGVMVEAKNWLIPGNGILIAQSK